MDIFSCTFTFLISISGGSSLLIICLSSLLYVTHRFNSHTCAFWSFCWILVGKACQSWRIRLVWNRIIGQKLYQNGLWSQNLNNLIFQVQIFTFKLVCYQVVSLRLNNSLLAYCCSFGKLDLLVCVEPRANILIWLLFPDCVSVQNFVLTFSNTWRRWWRPN